MRRLVAASWIGVSGSALLAAAPALAAGFTVGPGTTVTATQTLTSGETGLIEASGKIDTSGSSGPGVSGQNANTVTNHGEVTAKSDGIVLLDGNQVTNSGVIASGTGQVVGMDGYDGIQAGDNNIIANSGSITGIDDGIDVRNGNTITNSGSITASGTTSWDGVWGIIAGDNNKIYNELGATITSGQSEVQLGSHNYMRNGGTVGDTPWSSGIWGANNNTIVVTSTGTVLGQIYVFDNNKITNHGSIDKINIYTGNKIYNHGTIGLIETSVGTGNYILNTGTIGQGGILILSDAGRENTISNVGTIKGIQDGVYIRDGGTLAVLGATGKIEAERSGIRAADSREAPLVISVAGAILAKEDGIYAVTGPSSYGKAAAITITATGNIDSVNSRGIYTRTTAAEAGILSVTSGGVVTASKEGIYAYSAAGAVSLSAAAAVTSQTRSAIMAAGGGNVTVNAAAVITASSTTNSGAHGIDVRASGAGTVTVDVSGNVTSKGARGISATSSSGAVSVTSAGVVMAKQDGIRAEITSASSAAAVIVNVTSGSIASSDNDGISAITSGSGAVSVITTGNLMSSARRGIYARSASGTVTVAVNSGAVTSQASSAIQVAGSGNLWVSVGGTATGAAAEGAAGVQFGSGTESGASNTLTVASGGVVNNAGGLNQLAILGASGNDTVTNAGTVAGNINLGTGPNSFFNAAAGAFTMGTTINLGAGNALTNAGTLSPGGNGAVATTALTGNLTQLAGGVIAVDVNPAAGTADRINVSGTAVLGGTVAANLLNPVTAMQEFTILSAAGGVTNNGLETQDTVAATLSLLYPNANDVVLKVEVNFVDTAGLNPNQTRLAGNFNGLIGNAGGVQPVLNALIGIEDFGGYEHALNQLSPEAYLHAAMAGVFSAQAFSDTLMGCREREGTYAYIAEGKCLWMDMGGGNLSRDRTSDYLGSDQTSWRLGGGAQFAVSDTLRASVGARYEHVNQDVYDNASNDGSWGHIGAALSYNPGAWLLAGALSGGKGWVDTDRNMGFGGFAGQAEGEQDLNYVHGKLRAAYLFDMGQWYAKPVVDLDVSWLSYGDVSEDGGSGAGLDISSQQDTVLSATPMLEIGGQMEMANGALVRPYLQLGAAFYGDTSLQIDSQFLDAPGGTPSFMTELELDRVLADISLGLDVLAVENLNVQVSYDGLFGSNTTSNAGALRLEWRL